MPSNFDDVKEGESLQYYSKSQGAWVQTTVSAVDQVGFKIACRQNKVFPFENPEGVRRISSRARGVWDPSWGEKLEETLKTCGGVMGIFEMYSALFPSAESRAGLAQMLRSFFPTSAGDPVSAAGSVPSTQAPGVASAGSAPFTQAPGVASFQGFLHPSMLSFEPRSWDLFFVYESDFKREVKAIITDGLVHLPAFQVQLVEQLTPLSPVPDFAWKPDGSYRTFVGIAAVMFISITIVHDATMSPPQWLAQDLSKMAGVYLHQPSQLRRGMGALKTTILASKQNRMVDPLMLDFMLQGLCSSSALDALAGGSGSAVRSVSAQGSGGAVNLAGAEAFINRYNASVNYDPSLELKDRAALRQRNLLDPQKCSPEMKQALRSACGE